MESRKDDKTPKDVGDEDELEQREYSSPPCYLHEFEQQQKESKSRQARKEPDLAPDSTSRDAPESKRRR